MCDLSSPRYTAYRGQATKRGRRGGGCGQLGNVRGRGGNRRLGFPTPPQRSPELSTADGSPAPFCRCLPVGCVLGAAQIGPLQFERGRKLSRPSQPEGPGCPERVHRRALAVPLTCPTELSSPRYTAYREAPTERGGRPVGCGQLGNVHGRRFGLSGPPQHGSELSTGDGSRTSFCRLSPVSCISGAAQIGPSGIVEGKRLSEPSRGSSCPERAHRSAPTSRLQQRQGCSTELSSPRYTAYRDAPAERGERKAGCGQLWCGCAGGEPRHDEGETATAQERDARDACQHDKPRRAEMSSPQYTAYRQAPTERGGRTDGCGQLRCGALHRSGGEAATARERAAEAEEPR
ncbi:hypothetical protein JOD54_005739 [Actinokineospora baliensis]|nr:hypothetical protein [Actinokineospora baliensis]